MSEREDSEERQAVPERPGAVFVLGAPGAGAPHLAGALQRLAGTGPLEREPGGAPATGAHGDRLHAESAAETDAEPAGETCVVDGAPKRSLQVPFLNAVYENARFIFCWRPPDEAMALAYRAWEGGAAVTHPELEGWEGPPWSFALIPDWTELAGLELGEIVGRQWARITATALEDLEQLPPTSWGVTSRAALWGDPAAELGRLCGFVGLEPVGLRVAAEDLRGALQAEPEPGELPDDLREALPAAGEVARRAQSFLAQPRRARGANADPASTQSPLRSVHTGSMADLLGRLGASLIISTYQAGKLILARKDGIRLNTHFRNFDQPMGIGLSDDKLAIGTRSAILEYRNMPAAAAKLEPKNTHDGCFILRRTHTTGDVRIHDVAYCRGELWMVATAFSCLATFDEDHSFVPRWQPPFVSKLEPGDRCHLNGMEVVDDEVRWATALGRTDEPGGWRERKASGGVLMHVPSGEIVLEGLSMPHSPSWRDGQLWFLESGQGRLCRADPEAGTHETVCELPGFTRGLAFAGPLAFVGLSQIRETKTFGGLPLEDRLKEKLCGVWAVSLETGEIAGFLRFEQAVQEVYDVAVVGMRKPEVAEVNSDTTRHSYVIKGWKG